MCVRATTLILMSWTLLLTLYLTVSYRDPILLLQEGARQLGGRERIGRAVLAVDRWTVGGRPGSLSNREGNRTGAMGLCPACTCTCRQLHPSGMLYHSRTIIWSPAVETFAARAWGSSNFGGAGACAAGCPYPSAQQTAVPVPDAHTASRGEVAYSGYASMPPCEALQ